MHVALSVSFWSFFAVSCVVLFCVALLLFLVTWPFDRSGRVLHLFSCFWAQLYFYVNPLWSLRVEGREHLPWKGAAVLVSNHESLGDILSLFGLYRPFKWVSKASVFKVPFLGWNMTLNGYVPLVRGDAASIAHMMELCRRWLSRGVPVLIVPGGRSLGGRRGEGLQGWGLPARGGAAVSGDSHRHQRHAGVAAEERLCDSRDAAVRVLEPVHPSAFGGDMAALREAVRNRIICAKREIDAALAAG